MVAHALGLGKVKGCEIDYAGVNYFVSDFELAGYNTNLRC